MVVAAEKAVEEVEVEKVIVHDLTRKEAIQPVKIADKTFDVTAIETGLSEQEIRDFRKAQEEGLRLSKDKHSNEIMANWKLGSKIDTMMSIIEAKDGTRGAQAALHCAKVFNCLEKQATDYRRFSQIFPDSKEVKKLLDYEPSWTVVRYLLQFETPSAREDSMKWLVYEGKFISSGDLGRIQDAKAAAGERGDKIAMTDLAKKVIDEKEAKKKAKEDSKKAAIEEKLGEPKDAVVDAVPDSGATSKPAGGMRPEKDPDLVSSSKLLKQSEARAGDLQETLALVLMRIKKLDDNEGSDKAYKKFVTTFKDKLLPELQGVRSIIDTIEAEFTSKVPDPA